MANTVQRDTASTTRTDHIRTLDLCIIPLPVSDEELLSSLLRQIADLCPSAQILLVIDAIPRYLLLHCPHIVLPQVTVINVIFPHKNCLPELAELVFRARIHPRLLFLSKPFERPLQLGPRTNEDGEGYDTPNIDSWHQHSDPRCPAPILRMLVSRYYTTSLDGLESGMWRRVSRPRRLGFTKSV